MTWDVLEKVHSPSSYKIQNKKINLNDLNGGRDPVAGT